METFGQRFARLRKEKGLKQDEIASKVNISPQAVSKWENDISSPDISILPQLAEILGCSLDELLGRKIEVCNVVNKENRKNINSMMLKINIKSKEGDKVNINLPMALIKLCIDTGKEFPKINGNTALNDIDFHQIFDLVEQGVVGKLVEIESGNGDIVNISVE